MVKMIKWEPSIYVPNIGVIKLTLEQVRAISECVLLKTQSAKDDQNGR